MEVQCDTCLNIFTDKISYEIHIKLFKCSQDNKNSNSKNYYCPVCDRQFRLLSNLQRHQETITHQETLEKIIKQENIITNNDNQTKTILIDLTPRRKELSLEEMDKLNQEKQRNHQDSENENENENDNKKEDMDMFLIQLKKQRELDLLPPQPQSQQYQPIIKQESNLNLYIAEDPGFNLALELQNTKMSLNDKTDNDISLNYNNEDEFLNIFKIKQKEMLEKTKEKEIPIIFPKKQQQQQITKINTSVPQNNKLYPIEFIKTPVWEKLSLIIKNNIHNPDINVIAARSILTLLVSSPLSDYLIICTYVYYSEDLEQKRELRLSMVKAMLEVYNNYLKLSKNRQILWNNKNVAMAINIMKNWKIDIFLQNLGF